MADRVDAAPETGLARRVGSAMAWGQLGKLLELLLTTVIAVIAVRALQPQAFGTYSLLTNLAGVASVLIPVVTTDGLGAVIPRFPDARERLYLVVLIAALRVGVILGVAALAVPLWNLVRDQLGLHHVTIQVLVAAVGYWAAQDLLNTIAGYYSATLNLRTVTLWRAGGQLATLIGLLVIVGLHVVSVGSALAVVATGYLVGAAALAIGLRSAGRPRSPGADRTRFVLGFTRNVWLIGVVSLAYTPQVYVLMIGLITKRAAEVAYYVAAVGVLGRVQALLIAGWSSIIIPTFGALHRRDGLPGLARGFRLFTKFWLIIAAPTSALLLVLADPLIKVLFGHSYARSVSLLELVAAFGFVTAFLSAPSSLSALWALDLQPLVAKVRLLTASIGFLVSIFLIYYYEAAGAVIGAGVTTAVTSVIEFVLARRAVHYAYPAAFAGWTAAASLVLVLPAIVVRPHGPLGMLVSVVLGLAGVALAAVLVKPFGEDDLAALRSISPRLADSGLRRFVRA